MLAGIRCQESHQAEGIWNWAVGSSMTSWEVPCNVLASLIYVPKHSKLCITETRSSRSCWACMPGTYCWMAFLEKPLTG